MVRVKPLNLSSALGMIKYMDSMPLGSAMDDLIRTSNGAWGFADEFGDISGTAGFRIDAGVPKIGNKTVGDFLKMSSKARLDFLSNDAVFDAVRTRMDNAVNNNFTDNFTRVLDEGVPVRNKAQADLMNIDGKTVKNPGKFDFLVKNMDKALKFGAVAAVSTWSAIKLVELAEAGSGCFLVGPEGEESKVSGGDCDCLGGSDNPNAQSCCEACVESGDDVLCPGTTWNNPDVDPPVDYVCPTPTTAGRARRMRANPTLSVSAAKARDRASGLARSKKAAAAGGGEQRSLLGGNDETCVSCGCASANWLLCHRDLGVFDVIANMAASVGKKIVETVVDIGEGILDTFYELADAAADLLAGPLKLIAIVVGGAVGAAVVVTTIIFVVRAVKRKKSGGGLRGGGGRGWDRPPTNLLF